MARAELRRASAQRDVVPFGNGQARLKTRPTAEGNSVQHRSMTRHAITIFVAALLVFAVQPLLGKLLLPWFGGSATVWTTCLMFFQVGLLAGYAYAHGISRWLSPRGQAGLHVALLTASLALLPIAPLAELWKPSPTAWPTGWILLLLAANIGLPFVLLTATTPLVTNWFSTTRPATSPYRLYALSNAGSLLALVAYPFLIEPLWSVRDQIVAWSWGYVAFVALTSWCALSRCREPSGTGVATSAGEMSDDARKWQTRPISASSTEHSPRRDILLWLSLSTCGSVMLVATTNQLCQEVAAVPFLWVLPLVIYLTTFIAAFGGPRDTTAERGSSSWRPDAADLCLALCRTAHAALAANRRLQPVAVGRVHDLPRRAGTGSAVGPTPHALLPVHCGGRGDRRLVCGLDRATDFSRLLGIPSRCARRLRTYHARRAPNGGWDFREQPAIRRAAGVGLVALAVVLAGEVYYGQLNAIESVRNFYGVLRVVEGDDDDRLGPYRRLVHGRIDHGRQYLGERASLADALFRQGERHRPGDAAAPAATTPIRHIGRFASASSASAPGRSPHTASPADLIQYYEINAAVEDLCRAVFHLCQRFAGDGGP